MYQGRVGRDAGQRRRLGASQPPGAGGPRLRPSPGANSYVYRFVPNDKADLTKGGTLQALQIESAGGGPTTAAQLQAGDTTTTSTLPGAYGGVFRLSMSSPSARTGRISIAVVGNKRHTGPDNVAFLTSKDLLVVEDAGDSLHAARNALNSGYRYTVAGRRGRHTSPRATRWLAEVHDASATFDALGGPGYNDGDNEITGIHVSDGDPTQAGILGARRPNPDSGRWRTFWTQQHGDNITWEVSWHASL
jgi:hypothetical protein